MVRSLDTLSRNMNILQKRIENSSANISNIKTPGYKFQDMIQSTLGEEDMVNYQGGNRIDRLQNLGGFTFGNQIDEVYRSFTPGNLVNTGNETDFAINGDGFFTIRMNNGQVGYTKNGNFRLDENNRLVTMDGHVVLGVDGMGERTEIVLLTNDIRLDSSGNFIGTNLSFEITDFDNYDNLNSAGEAIFLSGAGYRLDEAKIEQGFIEASNVDLAGEMVKLIELSRQFEANQKFLHATNETLSKAVNEVGRV